MSNRAWEAIFNFYDIHKHDFNSEPFIITANEIKDATRQFKANKDREPRLICKHDTREARPRLFQEKNLFLLPIKNGTYAILRGEGYVDIPPIDTAPETYISQLDYDLDTVKVGNSEMQHIDYAYATSLIRSIMDDDSLVLTIRGRKYTPAFKFFVRETEVETISVQTEVDAGYEGRQQIVLVEAKNNNARNVIIRQLFYPFRQWSKHTDKPISTIFFERYGNEFHVWQFAFDDEFDYNSIRLINSGRYIIQQQDE